MNKTIKAFTLGLAGAATALALNLAAPQKAEARITDCHYGEAGQLMEQDLCDVTRRINANGHIVFDIADVRTGERFATVVLWDDDTAEWIMPNGHVNRNIVTEDLPNDNVRLVNMDNDFNFIFQAR